MEALKIKGFSFGKTPRPQLDRKNANKNIFYESSGLSENSRDRQSTSSNSNVTKRNAEEWVDGFLVRGKEDVQEMAMMLREIGLSPLRLGITTDDLQWGRQPETGSPADVARVLSTSPDMSSASNREETHEANSRTPLSQSPLLPEECQQPSEQSTPAESASSPSLVEVAVGDNFVGGSNGHTQNAEAPPEKERSSIVSNHSRLGGVNGSKLQGSSRLSGVGLHPEDSPSLSATQRQAGAANLEHPTERTRSESLSGDHAQGIQTTPTVAPPASASNNTNSSSLQTDRRKKQEEVGRSRGSGPLILKPPPWRTVSSIGPILSTKDMINSLAPDAAEGFLCISSDSEREEEGEQEVEDSPEPSPTSSRTVQNEQMNRLSNGAGIVPSRAANQPDEFGTEHVDDTERELAGRQVGEKVTVKSANGGLAVVDLTTTVKNSPESDEKVVYRTFSMCMEGPKFPWTKGCRLGAGSFGTVYNAVDSGGMFFAVKEVSITEHDQQAQRALAQLKQEVELLKNFKHENIVQYLGTDRGSDKLYIFLELVELGSLATVYKNFELADSQISKYTRDTLRGLEYLHNRNILHRDIKCANILVDKTGTCKLADFGMAKQISSLDLAKTCMGSAYWMAPEVINPQKTYGSPADIWSLGCSVLELATRAPPFGEMEWYRAMFTVGRGNAPPIPDTLSESLREFIKPCFEIEPKNRPTATELLQHPFILQGSAVSANSGRHVLPCSTTNLQRLTEERLSDFSTPQSSQEDSPVNVEGR